jgi:hypothetical protein
MVLDLFNVPSVLNALLTCARREGECNVTYLPFLLVSLLTRLEHDIHSLGRVRENRLVNSALRGIWIEHFRYSTLDLVLV